MQNHFMFSYIENISSYLKMWSPNEKQLLISNKINIHEVLVTYGITYKFSSSFQEQEQLMILFSFLQQIYWAPMVHSIEIFSSCYFSIFAEIAKKVQNITF